MHVNFVVMQHDYNGMQLMYVNIRLLYMYVDMQHNLAYDIDKLHISRKVLYVFKVSHVN